MNAMTIDKVEFRRVFTNIGAASIEVHIAAQSGAKASTMRVDEKLMDLHIDGSIEALKEKLAPLLQGRDVSNQKEIDAMLTDAAASFSQVTPFISSVSQAVLETSAAAMGISIVERLSQLTGLEGKIPMPMSGAIVAGVNYGSETTYQGKPWWGYISTGFDETDDAVNALWVTSRKWQDIIKKRFGVKISAHSGNLFYPDSFFPTPEALCEALSQAIVDGGFEGRVGIFADFGAHQRYDAGHTCYNGLLSKEAFCGDHLKKLCQIVRDYPVAAVIDPLEPSDKMGYEILKGQCGIVCSRGANAGILANVFDEMTVSQAVELAGRAKAKGIPFVPEFSLTPGFKAMDYYIALGVDTALRCGMTDYANRALELSGKYKQKYIKT